MFNSKNNRLQIIQQDRESVAAGRFYPIKPHELRNDIKTIFSDASNYHVDNFLQAIIVPHAGYIFSGEVAGAAYKTLKKFDTPVNVFIIGTSHTKNFDGASIYYKGDYKTPLGKVKVNKEIANKLFKANKHIFFDSNAHQNEHTIEVQLPFLQHLYGDNLNIIPILIGTQKTTICKSLAQTLKPYFKRDNLFVFSSDFSHYPEYHDAIKTDAIIAKAIIRNNPDTFVKARNKIKDMHLNSLITPICGFSSIYTLLNLTKDDAYSYKLFNYKNSGDHTYFGDKSRVVGYWSIGIIDQREAFYLTNSEKESLIDLAHTSLSNMLLNNKAESVPEKYLTDTLKTKMGAFVSIYVKGKLRGCIGRFESSLPLYKIIQNMTHAAATSDSRFEPIQISELNDVIIEISVLTPLDMVHDIREIKLGKHGVYMNFNGKTGTLLPQVATKNKWTLVEFLENCAIKKAGIKRDDWKSAELYKFEAIVFKG